MTEDERDGYPRTSQFRVYDTSVRTEPLITGRTPSPWLMDNLHFIRQREFYDSCITEDGLKALLALRKPAPIK
jgi:hypothetical protein